MPDDIFEARNSPGFGLFILIGSILFFGVGLFLIWQGYMMPKREDGIAVMILGGVTIALFGWNIAKNLPGMFGRGVVMRIDANGIWWKRFSDRTIPWSDIIRAFPLRYNRQQLVGLSLHDSGQYVSGRARTLAQRWNHALGADVLLRAQGTDRSYQDMCDAIAWFMPLSSQGAR